MRASYRKGVCNISTAETKVVFVLCYYALFGLVTLTTFSVEFAHLEEPYKNTTFVKLLDQEWNVIVQALRTSAIMHW